MSIVPDKISFIELVSASSNTTFKVPDFQRTYVWKTADEVEEFWQDIDEHFIDTHKNEAQRQPFCL